MQYTVHALPCCTFEKFTRAFKKLSAKFGGKDIFFIRNSLALSGLLTSEEMVGSETKKFVQHEKKSGKLSFILQSMTASHFFHYGDVMSYNSLYN